jgi:hypothetical protein
MTEGLFLFFVPNLPGWSFQKGTALILSYTSPALHKVTAVLFKMTSQKGFHPRPAVVLFSKVCSTRTPRRMYRCEQEKLCQTLENKTTSSECHRCRLEKNGRDRISVYPVNEYVKEEVMATAIFLLTGRPKYSNDIKPMKGTIWAGFKK